MALAMAALQSKSATIHSEASIRPPTSCKLPEQRLWKAQYDMSMLMMDGFVHLN